MGPMIELGENLELEVVPITETKPLCVLDPMNGPDVVFSFKAEG